LRVDRHGRLGGREERMGIFLSIPIPGLNVSELERIHEWSWKGQFGMRFSELVAQVEELAKDLGLLNGRLSHLEADLSDVQDVIREMDAVIEPGDDD
jgi:hypothetical protein